MRLSMRTFRMLKKITRPGLVLMAVMGLTTAALAQTHPDDPWEPMNRKIYVFNDAIDTVAVKPVARGYQRVVPRFARTGVRNFFDNLASINYFVNNMLQLKFGDAMHDSGRFVVNSTLGLGGLLDVASEMGLRKSDEDFGQTLGYWGVYSGPYLVVPLIGNSTVRDTLGMLPGLFLNPVFWLQNEGPRTALYVVERVDTRTEYFAAEEMIRGDPYIFVRDALLQRREYLVNDGEVDDDSWDE